MSHQADDPSTGLFVLLYVAMVALIIWLQLAVWCLGDPKLDRGCGGVGIFFPVWLLVAAPLPIAALVVYKVDFERLYKRRARFFGSTLVAIAVALECALNMFPNAWNGLALYVIGAVGLITAYRVNRR